jgi:hypothetical protein
MTGAVSLRGKSGLPRQHSRETLIATSAIRIPPKSFPSIVDSKSNLRILHPGRYCGRLKKAMPGLEDREKLEIAVLTSDALCSRRSKDLLIATSAIRIQHKLFRISAEVDSNRHILHGRIRRRHETRRSAFGPLTPNLEPLFSNRNTPTFRNRHNPRRISHLKFLTGTGIVLFQSEPPVISVQPWKAAS